MKRRFIFALIAFAVVVNSSSISCFGQTNGDTTKNIFYGGAGRQCLIYIKYERLLVNHDWAQTFVNIGYGGVPGEHTLPYNEPRHNILTFEAGQLIGYRYFFLELGIEPTLTFYGNITYVEINGILGLRFQTRNLKFSGLFFQVGYIPRVYYTYESNIASPIYFGLGINF